MSNSNLKVENVCYLDTDILISPLAPNIFDHHKKGRVSLVSQWYNLPYRRDDILRRIAFFRNRYFSPDYPLDSLLFATLKQLFDFSSLPEQPDYACAGLFVFNVDEFATSMSHFFHTYESSILTPSAGGDELYFNFFIQTNDLGNWLNYQFQALWIYEVAVNYSFLYESGASDNHLVKKCIEASLFSNYFLHFAGSWHESKMWEQVKVLDDKESIEKFNDFNSYLTVPVTGRPQGSIKPKEIS